MRFIVYILAPLLPASMSLMIVAVTCLVASEITKMCMLNTRSHLLATATGHKRPHLATSGHARWSQTTVGRVPTAAGRLMPILSPVIPIFLHHYQFLVENHIEHLVSYPDRQEPDYWEIVNCRSKTMFMHLL